MELASMLLPLSLVLSWPSFIVIFCSGIDYKQAESPLAIVAAAVSISSLALILSTDGPLIGLLLILTAVLASHVMLRAKSPVALALSCISFFAYVAHGG